jgi:hypothetical protein
MRELQVASVGTAEADLAGKADAEEKALADVAVKEVALASAADEPARAAAKSALETSKATAEKATQTRLDAEGVLAAQKLSVAAIDRALALAGSTGSASTGGVIESNQSLFRGDLTAVALAVEKIVTGTLGMTNGPDFCAVLLSDASRTGSTVNQDSKVFGTCLQMLQTGGMLVVQ